MHAAADPEAANGWKTRITGATRFLVAWLALYAVATLFVSNPYWSEASASAPIDWRHVMYLHGLLIGLVGVVSLVVVDAFAFPSRHVRSFIAGGAVAATLLAGIGGVFDRAPTDTLALWTQIAGFFSLDEILLTLIWAFWQDWRAGRAPSRTLSFAVTGLGAVSMFVAAVMGHLAGWLLEFGEHSPFDWPARYAHFIGIPFSAWEANLITSHSHEMVMALIATVIGTMAWHYGQRRQATAPLPTAALVGLAMVAFGVVAMTVIYVVAGFTAAQPPTLFAFGPGGVSGIAGDDLVTGVFIMVGGMLAWLGFLLAAPQGEAHRGPAWQAIVVSLVLSVLTVVGGGYAIELHEAYFGAGNPKAAGAAADATFTLWHQQYAFFLIPAAIVLVYLADRLLSPRLSAAVVRNMLLGLVVAFLGGLFYVFVVPGLITWGYFVIAIGFALVLYAVGRMWWGLEHELAAARLAQVPQPARGTDPGVGA
jgi:hypothetical protein